jgi:hypothetical protein
MTDGLDQLLAASAITLLQADPVLTVLDGFAPPATEPPYVLVYTSLGRPSADPDNSIDGRSRVFTARWYCHCVGGDAKAARAIAQRVRTQLLDVRPVIAGLECGLIREQPDPPTPIRDEMTGSLVMDAICIYELRASS